MNGLRRSAKRSLPLALALALPLAPAPGSAHHGAPAADAPPRPSTPAAPIELTVYAAASLKDVLNALGPACGRAAGAALLFNFGASNDLARQILAANKADVFFSADEGWMDQVAAQHLVDAPSRRSLLSSRLVVIVPADSSLTIGGASDLAGDKVKRLSLANPEAVPAGRYTRAWLEKTGVWDRIQAKVVPAPDVRAAMAAVESGAIEAGVVYNTDAAIAKRAKVVFTVPEAEGPRISYPVAALKDRPHLEAARKVVGCFAGAEGKAAFERFGFVVLDATAGGGGAAPPAASR